MRYRDRLVNVLDQYRSGKLSQSDAKNKLNDLYTAQTNTNQGKQGASP